MVPSQYCCHSEWMMLLLWSIENIVLPKLSVIECWPGINFLDRDGGIVGFAMACSNTFGLVTGAFLLGFGLSEIPRNIWKNADWSHRQKVLSHRVAKMAVKLDGAHQEYSNAIVVSTFHKLLSNNMQLLASCWSYCSISGCSSHFKSNVKTWPFEALHGYYWQHGSSNGTCCTLRMTWISLLLLFKISYDFMSIAAAGGSFL